MARLKAANNAQSLLSANITASATSLTVADGSVFPEPPFLITIDDEIIEVGTKTGNTFSGLLRGQEGTVAAPHSSGAIVENRMTAGSYNELATQQQVNELQNTIVAHLADNTPHREAVSIERKNPDDDGIFKLIEFRRPDRTLINTSQLYGTSPYTSRTVKYYDKNGNLVQTVEYSITYTDDGELISEVIRSVE